MKNKVCIYLANFGEVLVIVGAAIWITGWSGASYIFAVGALLFAVGRLMEVHPETQSVVLRRLYKQQAIGIFMLFASVGMMFFYPYSRTGWLLPFVVFVVLEVYSAFRIPAVMKKEEADKREN